MQSSFSSRPRNDEHNAFSGVGPPGNRRKVDESSRLFDVFINHRGPDVKQTLARRLYNSLKEHGIRAFLDSEEKELGDSFPSTIENAIHSASAHIAIFSNGYAASPWCLEELVLMLQSSAKIIPVFYGVNPSALRFVEGGEYAGAFKTYEEKGRYMEKLQEWKDALHSVSFITGHEISSRFSSSDCKNIVSAVLKEIQRKEPLHVAKYPVGMHWAVEDFERHCWINHGGEGKTQIVGICGMGGVGKTTLAKELFNREQSKYTEACFLFDVREAYANKTFPSLQKKLLRDLYKKDNINFQCTEEGTSHIGDCIRRSKQMSFLLVLDDIDHLEQLDALLIRDMLHRSGNSLVIVTTRDAGVLKNAGIRAIYNLPRMHTYQAKELFCCHAFGQSYPSSGYEKLVDLFVEECGGLPLSLQVLGRHVHGEDQKFWELALDAVKKTLPQDIHKRLRVSIDTLEKYEKEIFMDVACFFIGEPEKVAIRVWEGSGWSAQYALERLRNKCLLKETLSLKNWRRFRVDPRGQISGLRMHDHLRDLGRQMADELSHPPRLWRSHHLQSLESKGFQSILSQPANFRYLHSFTDRSLGWKIKYFLGESDTPLQPSSALLSLELELIKGSCHELTTIPPWIPLQNLRYLMIRDGNLERLWQNNDKAPLALKELRICNIGMLEELSLDLLYLLEVLVIQNCGYLNSLAGIHNLAKLESLIIRNCGEVEDLRLVQLSCLKEITIDGCGHLKSVRICDLTKLEKFGIFECGELEELSLVCVSSLDYCFISRLPRLERVEVEGCHNLISIHEPDWNHDVIWKTWKLVKLNIYDCPKLEIIPCELLHLLERVQILYCSNQTIRKYILNMKRLPANFIKVIGQAADGAESTLNADLFCDFISAKSVTKIGTEATRNHMGRHVVGAIILCALVVVNTSAAAKRINDFTRECDINPWLKCEMHEGQWIITSVTSKPDEIDRYFLNKGNCFPFDYLCFPEDAMVRNVTIPVMRGEEQKVLTVLRTIVRNLYKTCEDMAFPVVHGEASGMGQHICTPPKC